MRYFATIFLTPLAFGMRIETLSFIAKVCHFCWTNFLCHQRCWRLTKANGIFIIFKKMFFLFASSLSFLLLLFLYNDHNFIYWWQKENIRNERRRGRGETLFYSSLKYQKLSPWDQTFSLVTAQKLIQFPIEFPYLRISLLTSKVLYDCRMLWLTYE